MCQRVHNMTSVNYLSSILFICLLILFQYNVSIEGNGKLIILKSCSLKRNLTCPRNIQGITTPPKSNWRESTHSGDTFCSMLRGVVVQLKLTLQRWGRQVTVWLQEVYNIVACNIFPIKHCVQLLLEEFRAINIQQTVHYFWLPDLGKAMDFSNYSVNQTMEPSAIAGENHTDVFHGASKLISGIHCTMKSLSLSNKSIINKMNQMDTLDYFHLGLTTLCLLVIFLHLVKKWLIKRQVLSFILNKDNTVDQKRQLKTLIKIAKRQKQLLFDMAEKEKEIQRLEKLSEKLMTQNTSLRLKNETWLGCVNNNLNLTSGILTKLTSMEEFFSSINYSS